LSTSLLSVSGETSLSENWPLSQLRLSGTLPLLLEEPSNSKGRGRFINSGTDHNMDSGNFNSIRLSSSKYDGNATEKHSSDDRQSSSGLGNDEQDDLPGMDFDSRMDLGDENEGEDDHEGEQGEKEGGEEFGEHMDVDDDQKGAIRRTPRKQRRKNNPSEYVAFRFV